MSIAKKAAAALLSLTMLFSLTACSDTTWAAKADGYKVNAGIYIYYTMMAYYDAQDKAGVENSEDSDSSSAAETTTATTTATTTKKDLFASRIDGMDVKTWIKETASEDVKKFIAIEKEFDALGLTLTDTQKTQINNALSNTWSVNSELFEKNGISEASMKQLIQSSYKQDAIFQSYYGAGGSEEVSQDELNRYIDENNARVKYIAIQLKDGEGNLFKSADKAKAMKMAEEYKERAAAENFDDLITEYNDYYQKQVEEATAEDSSSSSSSESSSSEAEEETDPYANEMILGKEGTTPSEKINKAIFEQTKTGEITIIEDDEIYYVVQRLDILERTDLLEDYRDSILYSLKGEEFEKKIETLGDGVLLEKNQASYKRYDPQDLYFGE